MSRRCPGPQPETSHQSSTAEGKDSLATRGKHSGRANAVSFLTWEDAETWMVLIFRLGQKSKRDLNKEVVHEMPEREVESSGLWKQLTVWISRLLDEGVD